MADDPPIHDSEPPAPSPARLMLRKLVFTLVVLAAAWLLVTQVAARYFFAPTTDAPQQQPPAPKATAAELPNPAIAILAERLDKVEAKLNVLEDMALAPPRPAPSPGFLPPPPPPPMHEPAADRQALSRLQEAMAEQDAELQSLREKLETVAGRSDDRLQLLNIFTQLKTALTQGAPFAKPLAQLEEHFAGDTNMLLLLDEFAPYAENGAPTLASLQAHFQQDIRQVFASEGAARSFMRSLRSLVTIRKVGIKHTGGDDESIIARAEALLGEGNINGALQELASLTPPARQTLAAWLAQAEAYLLLRESLGQLEIGLSDPESKPAPAAHE